MNEYEPLRVLYGLFLGAFIIIAGVLTLTSKDEPGIGFRIGYTYLSERARRKANRVSGIGTILTGVALIILSPFLPMAGLIAIMLLVSLGAIFYAVFIALTSAYEEGYY